MNGRIWHYIVRKPTIKRKKSVYFRNEYRAVPSSMVSQIDAAPKYGCCITADFFIMQGWTMRQDLAALASRRSPRHGGKSSLAGNDKRRRPHRGQHLDPSTLPACYFQEAGRRKTRESSCCHPLKSRQHHKRGSTPSRLQFPRSRTSPVLAAIIGDGLMA